MDQTNTAFLITSTKQHALHYVAIEGAFQITL